MADIVKWHPNERIDLADVEKMQLNIVDEDQRVLNSIVATSKLRILDGFTRSGAAAIMTINLGKAIVAEIRSGATRYGQLLTEGLASQTVDFTGKSVATHGVWIRFVYSDGTKGNRFFWDDVADAEEVRFVDTRQVAGWNVSISVASPGPEWTQIYSVAWDGAALSSSTITDMRHFLFEGRANAFFDPAWGGAANDRNNDRATYGVKDLESFASAVLQKIKEMQSQNDDWWIETVEPLDEKVSRSGDGGLVGNYTITGNLTATGTFSLGGFLSGSSGAQFLGTLEAIFSDATTGDPDPDTHGGLLVNNTDATTGTVAPLYLLNGAGAARDGFVLYSERGAASSVDFRIDRIVDNNFSESLLRLLDNGNFEILSGNISASSYMEATTFRPTETPAAPDTGVINQLNKSNLIKAWARIKTTGSGSTLVDVISGMNVTGAVASTSLITVTIAADMADGNYMLLYSLSNATALSTTLLINADPANRTGATFAFSITDLGPPGFFNPRDDTRAITVDFIVLGAQT